MNVPHAQPKYNPWVHVLEETLNTPHENASNNSWRWSFRDDSDTSLGWRPLLLGVRGALKRLGARSDSIRLDPHGHRHRHMRPSLRKDPNDLIHRN